MKKALLSIFISFVAIAVCLPSSLGQAAEAPAPSAGITGASEDRSLPQPGLSYAGSVPGTVQPFPGKVSPSPIPSAAAAPKVEEPIAVRKDAPEAKIEIKDSKAGRRRSRRQRALDRARDKALEDAVKDQVGAMRAERIKEMPYLDRVYIRTSITPLKMQQKEEFLGGGAKTLQDLIARAQSVHTQSKAAHENISLYNRRVLLAFRKLFPEASFNFNDREGTLNGSPFSGDDWHVTLRQPIFNGGVLWNTFLQEKASLEAAKKQYDRTLADLVYDLSKAYFEYQRTLQTADEHRAVVEKMKRFAEMSEEKFKEKLISEIEHLNVQSLYSQMQFDLESANQDFELAKIEMQKYLDLSVNDTVTLSKIYDLNDVVLGQAVSPGGAAGAKSAHDVFKGQGKAPELPKLIDLSYGHRPELQVEAAKLQANRLTERVRWGEFLPKANLTYQFGALGEAYTNDGAQQGGLTGYKDEPVLKKEWQLMLELTWNAGGNKVSYAFDRDKKAASVQNWYSGGTMLRKNTMSVGVLDGLDAFVNVKQAEVDKLNQVVELEKAEKQVLQDVKQAYYDYQKATIQVNSTVKRLEYRKRLRDFSEYRLSKKEIELSEYLQAESDLARERGELHKALKDYFSARASLNHAVGIQNFLSMETPAKK
jgi:outer membrane protein TolC